MFKNNKKQFVNILKQDKQLKVEYKILDEDKIVKEDSSSFLLDGDYLSKDSISKLNILQNDIPQTYLNALITTPNQEVKVTNDIDKNAYECVKFDENSSIAITKNDVFEEGVYYSKCGIDHLISPFTILNNKIISKSLKNSLNVLIYDNSLYVLVKDKDKKIGKSGIKVLTAFEQMQDPKFSDDELLGQRIYDEVYFLEVQQTLSDLVQQYYQDNKDVEFLEEVNIYYTINQISDEQLDSLNETLMAKVNYYQINMNEELFNLTSKIESEEVSFIEVRDKKKNNNSLLWTALAAISMLGVVGAIYYQMSQKVEQEKQPEQKQIKKEIKQEVKKPKIEKKEEVIASFPSHQDYNTKIVQDLMTLFDVVPYDAILNEIGVDKNSSTFVCNFISTTTSNEDMKLDLEKIYKESKAILTYANNAVLSTIVTNKGLLNTPKPVKNITYQEHEFMSIAQVSKYLERIVLNSSSIKYKTKRKDKYTTYRFTVESLVAEPQNFFDFVGELNKKNIPLVVDYPMEFAKTNDGISVKFDMVFYQQNKPLIKPKK